MKTLQNITSEDIQRYARIGLQWLAAYLVTHGAISPTASWVQPAIGVLVGAATLGWTLYGNRIQAKINEIAKQDVVVGMVLKDQTIADNTPTAKVIGPEDKKV